MKVNFEPTLFNPLYFHLRKYMNDSNIRTILFYGGSSSAKSYSAMQILSIETLAKNYNTLVMRKVGKDLKDSIYSDFKSFSNKLANDLPGVYEIIENEIRVNNNRIRFKGLDNPERIKGISEFTKIYLDELTEFYYKDYSQIHKRLRGRKNQQILASWNPVSSKHWIKKKLIDVQIWYDLPKKIKDIEFSELSENSFVRINEKKDTILIKTTFLDNFWIVSHPKNKKIGFFDKHQIAHLQGLKELNENDYKIYALGEWGEQSEGLIFNEVKDFQNISKTLKNKILWTKYITLPNIDFWTGYGLDFGGGGNVTDEPDGSSKTVFLQVNINKSINVIYIKLLVYKGYIESHNLIEIVKEKAGFQFEVLADNARADKITELQNKGIMIIPAKSKEGKSNSVLSGYDILKNYKIFVHNSDIPIHTEFNNHKWKTNNITGETTEQPEDLYKDIPDALRYIVTYYHLNYNI
ncbi:MAG: hypothetical protein DRI95_00655 [Bacteroidetes bacterium]|nr:MAG: hypothetical protein DRI95_00655 [Bacteroidota bacterium]